MTDLHDSIAGNVFSRHNARVLLNGKYILFIGDSVQRAAYKDLVALLDDGSLLGRVLKELATSSNNLHKR